jgi:acylpyruvate hydrolase
MYLLTFQKDGVYRLGALLQDYIVDLNFSYAAYLAETEPVPYRLADAILPSDLVLFLQMGEKALQAAQQAVCYLQGWLEQQIYKQGPRGEQLVYTRKEVRVTAPVLSPGKIICIGLNYRDHCEEQGVKMPPRPLLFSKFATAVTGPLDDIVYPVLTTQLDYEAELAVVIGKQGKHIPREKALAYVGGYTVANDVSARDLQFSDRQWVRGKTFDTFAPMGDCLLTADALPDPHNLKIRLTVNGEVRQESNTGLMIFDVPYLINFISQVVTLLPGDIILTGTPAGVGAFRQPPQYLTPGDVVRVEIEKIGVLENRVVAETLPDTV